MASIDNDKKYPWTGLLFTPVQHRKKGYATSLLATLVNKLLLSGNVECGLTSDRSNSKTVRMLAQTGFNSIYYWVSYDIEK